MTLDLTALAAAYAVGVALLLMGYVLAGPVWVERHSIQLAGPGRARRVSGFGANGLCSPLAPPSSPPCAVSQTSPSSMTSSCPTGAQRSAFCLPLD
ncbi:MAG: hypothetical protein IPG56_15400 [Caulobacteraceae bacterium]|nr:hypothetical protein [Caulobacteraceae bacterium]